jgi:hypothetical protein
LAIKGKGKARSGRRVIAAPPRPQLVVRKPPLWRRPWVWGIVGAIAAAGIVIGVLVALHGRSVQRFKDREVAAVQTLASQFMAAFPADRQVVPPDLVALFPNVNSALSDLAANKGSAGAASSAADEMIAGGQKAQQGVVLVKVASLIPKTFDVSTDKGVKAPGATQVAALDAQLLMGQAFRLYVNAGHLMKSAAAATGSQQADLANQAKQLTAQAALLFDNGFRKVLNLLSALGHPLQIPSQSPPPTPGPSPSASASASGSPPASPQPSASPSS